MTQVVLTAAFRTALGDFGGTLKSVPPADLAQLIVEHTFKAVGGPSHLEKVIFGNCFSPLDQNMARIASYRAGVPESVPAFTINSTCGSSLQALISSVQAVQC